MYFRSVCCQSALQVKCCVYVCFSVRVCARTVRVEASLEHWYVTGLRQQGVIPSLIASVGNLNSSLLSVQFELNPENTAVDQLLHVQSQPVEIIYDAVSNRHALKHTRAHVHTQTPCSLRAKKPSKTTRTWHTYSELTGAYDVLVLL